MKSSLSLSIALALVTAACSTSDGPERSNTFEELLVFDAAALKKDDGVAANSARPAGIAAVAGKLFVALGNLTLDCMAPAGPGYLAVIDLASTETTEEEAGYRLIELPSACRNPQNVLAWEDSVAPRVFVACAGEYGWGETPSEALVAVDAVNEAPLFTTVFDGAGAAVTPGKMARLGSSLLVGDGNAGRLFRIDANSGELDPAFEQGIELCAPHATLGWQMTGDVLVSESSVFATCFATSELVELDADLNLVSTRVIGSGAQVLASTGDELLVGDTIDNALYAFDLSHEPIAQVQGSDRLGMATNQILVNGDRAFAITSTDNTIQVIDLSKARGGDFSTARVVDQIPTASSTSPDATNTNPYLGAIAGGHLYVTLMGACTPDGDTAGNRLIRVELGEGD
ncbi:MAG: hypothetical protein LBM75_04670 [Myxococcales bacterium]|jgi:hypothetical protein|nr:hypothetical protein [Myxococcales bacterium]